MMLTPLQLPSVNQNLSWDGGWTWCWRKENAKRQFGWQNVAKERLSTIYTRGSQLGVHLPISKGTFIVQPQQI